MNPESIPSAAKTRELASHVVCAHNFAAKSDNKIHDDEIATRMGYLGGLVPGVALYAYMTVPLVRDFGAEWIARGAMSAKFIQPLYDGEDATVHARVDHELPLSVNLRLTNPLGEPCAVGTASMPEPHPPVDPARYPRSPLPDTKLPPRADTLKKGTLLGSLRIDPGQAAYGGEFVGLLEELRETLPIYSGPSAPWHPALIPMRSNRLLIENVDLGPWIHAASEMEHHALPRPGEEIWLRGFIADSFVKRGHDMVTLDLAAFGEGDRVLARILHTAIVRPAQLAEQP